MILFVGPVILPETLNGARYLNFLDNTLRDLLMDMPLNRRRNIIFQQDGAPAHSTRVVREYLNETFGRWIGRNGPIAWPPRSPDLTPLDFYLWGRMKDIVYSNIINTRDDLINRIHEAGVEIQAELRNVDIANSLRTRILLCIQNGGQHFEHLLH